MRTSRRLFAGLVSLCSQFRPAALPSLVLIAAIAGLPTRGASAQQAAEPLMTLSGDGVRVVILEQGVGGEVSGEIHLGGHAYPFAGTLEEINGVEIGHGQVTIDGRAVEFTTREPEDDGVVHLTLAGKTYRLGYDAPEAPPQDVPATPIDIPAPDAKPAPQPANVQPLPEKPAALPERLRLNRVAFPDVNMGGVTAYTMLVPEGWRAAGQIEWREHGGVTPHPMPQVDVVAPDGSRFRVVPSLSFVYAEKSAAALAQERQMGIAGPALPGMPPPQDVGRFVAELIARQNPQATDIRILEQKRDQGLEQLMLRMAAANPNPNAPAPTWTAHIVDVTYAEKGVMYRERVRASMAVSAWSETQWMRTMNWGFYISNTIRAPEKQFQGVLPLLQCIAATFAPTDRWFAAEQLALSQMVANAHERNMEEIRRRGQMYSEISDQQMASFKSKMAAGDREQNRTMNRIYETSDFQSPDGSTVKLPIHYKNYYGDGNGNFVMTNSTLDAPGGEFKELKPLE